MSDKPAPRRDQKIVAHIKALHQAAGDDEAYATALQAIRDDGTLKPPQREAIYKTLAQQSLLWYLEACSGNPIDLSQLQQQGPGKSS